jgi:peptidoglycan/xylan/chitin deacetylase (PgdA/CDA1 family)
VEISNTPLKTEEIHIETEQAPSRLPGSALMDRYRCPDNFLECELEGELAPNEGYFQLKPDTICYGRTSAGFRRDRVRGDLYDAIADIGIEAGKVRVPFDPSEVIDNCRLERYQRHPFAESRISRKFYYWLRPLTNQWLRKHLQRSYARNWRESAFPQWPVDTTVERICETLMLLQMKAKRIQRVPFVWFWPRAAHGCVMMTHDVETERGRDFCQNLLDIDDRNGVKSTFQIVPEGRYAVQPEFLKAIRSRGFEIGIHDLNHDGLLFDDREEFLRRAERINQYGARFEARGFRAAVLYRKPEWYGALNFAFDMSIPNVAPLDPQRGGCCTVLPYFIGNMVELPLTTAQDYTLFHLLNMRSIDLWKEQIELILAKNGLVSFIVHPDYIQEPDTKAVYEKLLGHLAELREQRHLWFALPSDIERWWRARSQMTVVRDGDSWRIEGKGAEQAVLAFAKEVDGKLEYELTGWAAKASACETHG